MRRIEIAILCLLTVVAALPLEAASQVAWPLRTSADGRRLQDQTGADFTLLGDTAWSLVKETSLEDVRLYLDDLRSRGVNAAMARIVDGYFSTSDWDSQAGASPWGSNAPLPFTTFADPTAEPYWAWVDRVVQEAKDRDILLLFTPAYAGYECYQGDASSMALPSDAEMRAYGEFLGNRYKAFGNVLWVHGGDARTDVHCPEVTSKVEAIHAGIRAAWPEALHTAHSGRTVTGREGYGETLVDVDSSYDLCTSIGAASGFPSQIQSIYDAPVTKPFFVIEGYFDDRPVDPASDECLRAQTWWPLLGGGIGSVAGHESIICFDASKQGSCEPLASTGPPWESHLGYPGTAHMSLVRSVLARIDETRLVPDYAHAVVKAGFGSIFGSTYAAVASSPQAVVAYLPSQRQITVDFGAQGSVSAEWIRAADGAVTPLGQLSGTGVVLTPPAAGDWILIATSIGGSSDTTPPSVTLARPAAGPVTGEVVVEASATDDTGVVGVQFLLDGLPLGSEDTTAPYQISWDASSAAEGAHTLSARARDAAGHVGFAAAVGVTVDRTAPAAGLILPLPGFVRGIVSVVATATDAVGVAGVEFLRDGLPMADEDVSAPYRIVWNTGVEPDGTYTLSARARDTSGNLVTTPGVVVRLDRTPPVVALSHPAAGPVSGIVPVAALTSDVGGVAGVQFLLDGAPLGAEDTTVPYLVSWDTSLAAPGSHTLSAWARDAAGNVGVAYDVQVSLAFVDTRAPVVSITQPTGGTLSGTVLILASASDDVGVAGVQLRLDGVPLGAVDTTPPYQLVWETRSANDGPVLLSAEAWDEAGNRAVSAPVGVTLANALRLQALAAWGFDEGSGTTAADQSGNGYDGLVSGAAWTPSGRFGSALSFDGVDDVVIADHDGLDLQGEFTLSAWVYPAQGSTGWSAIVQKEIDAYFLHANSSGDRGAAAGATLDGVCCTHVFSGVTLPQQSWSHVAASYDGAMLRYFVAGVLAASSPATGSVEATPTPLHIGRNSYAGEGFAGRIDEVRIYARALTEAQIQSEMQLAVTPPPDTVPPWVQLASPAPGEVSGVVALEALASDTVGVEGVQFLLDGAPLGAEVGSPPYTASWDPATAGGGAHSLSAAARDAAGNVGTADDVVVVVDEPLDTTPPTVSISAPAAGSVAGLVTLRAAATDDVGVAGVQLLLDGAPFGAEASLPPYEAVWDTTAWSDGPVQVSAVARDAAGNRSFAADVLVTVDNRTTPALVAAWSFDEGTGATLGDGTGHGHDGSISGASWTAAGRYGGALVFDGVDDVVLVPDHDALDLGAAMTLSAWVYPSQTPSGWSAILQKEVDAYYLHAGSSGNRGAAAGGALGGVCCTSVFAGTAPAAERWSHLAMTWDGAQLAYYVDGQRIATTTASGSFQASGAPLRIGSNTYPGEAFAGRIDEVRIYAGALTQAEIQADMATPLSTP